MRSHSCHGVKTTDVPRHPERLVTTLLYQTEKHIISLFYSLLTKLKKIHTKHFLNKVAPQCNPVLCRFTQTAGIYTTAVSRDVYMWSESEFSDSNDFYATVCKPVSVCEAFPQELPNKQPGVSEQLQPQELKACSQTIVSLTHTVATKDIKTSKNLLSTICLNIFIYITFKFTTRKCFI